MRTLFQYCFLIIIVFGPFFLSAQSGIVVLLDTFSIEGMPGLHSYAYAQHEEKILFIGGRRDGLHGKFDAFGKAFANSDIFLVDIGSEQVWTTSNAQLPTSIREQLQSSNMEFYQDGDYLYFVGGYGESESQEKYLTYPYLTSIKISWLIEAMIRGQDISPYFHQIEDPYFAVAGGQLEKMGNTFYLVGGHLFNGIYAAGWGGNITQIYTDAIRKFKIQHQGDSLIIIDKEDIKDEWNFHRRDYNLVPQVSINGEESLCIFSGVFQPGIGNAPYLNLVNITSEGYKAIENFNQYLTQYHSAHLPLYDGHKNEMHTYFFGGMSQYITDETGMLKQDNRMPFVKTISRVSRAENGNYSEHALPTEMPFYVGTNAEFMISSQTSLKANGVVDLAGLPNDTSFIGYIFGGIETPEEDRNPYVNNRADITSASNTFFKVSIVKNASVSIDEIRLEGAFDLGFQVYPNPTIAHINASLNLHTLADIRFILQDQRGSIVKEWHFDKQTNGKQNYQLNLRTQASGIYTLTVCVEGTYISTQKFVIH